MTSVRRRLLRLPVSLVVALAAALAVLVAVAPTAIAADYVGRAAEELQKQPLYLDPEMAGVFSAGEVTDIRNRLESATTPVFVAVLPAKAASEAPGGDPRKLPAALHEATKRDGTYAVATGTSLYAGSTVIGSEAGDVAARVAAAHSNAAKAVLAFVDEVERAAQGDPPAGTGGGGDGGTVVPWLLLLAGGGGAAALVLARRKRAGRAREEAAQLAVLREVVDEDITSFGEELDEIELPAAGMDEGAREDYQRALDFYDRAKQIMAGARRPDDVRNVTQALEEGRYALARVQARQAGRPLPERRPPCFFDPRHGPSVEDVAWTPEGGATREVPVCAADAARIRDGLEPMTRTVPVGGGRRPYWEAGPMYAPWAYGWFGGFGSMLLPGLLVGTLLGSSFDAAPTHDVGADSGGWDDFGGGGGGFGDFGGGGGDFGG